MKNTLLAFVLGMAGLAAAQQPAAPAQPAGTQPLPNLLPRRPHRLKPRSRRKKSKILPNTTPM